MGKLSKVIGQYEEAEHLPASVISLPPMASSATFNGGFDWDATIGLPDHILDLVGGTVRGNPVLPHGANTPGTVRWQLDSGLRHDVSDGIITFGFATMRHALGLNNNPGFGEGGGYSPFTPEQMAAARIAITNWDDLIAARFVEIQPGPGASSYGRQTTDIVLANTYTGPAQAWAYYPGYGRQYERIAGDVWIADPAYNSSNGQLEPGQYGLQTLNHELGHAIGLNHPGAYNYGDGNGDITYDTDAEYFQDSNQFTIMSYFDSYETGAQPIDWNLMRFVYPSTPMVDDVRVIQQIYGADMTTRIGNTRYGFNATGDVTNEAMRFVANEMATVFTIWDAGGTDTLDLSGYYTDSVIDLREGAYSSAGGWGAFNPSLIGVDPTLATINANNIASGLGLRTQRLFDIYFEGGVSDDGGATFVNEGVSWRDITGTGERLLMEQNIGIAYGAVIENAVGGHGNDRINGNSATNSFTGGGGADIFIIARYGVGDRSVDTITDFVSGTDRIDLSELHVTAARVTFDAASHQLRVDTDGIGGYDLAVIVTNSSVNLATDLIF